MGQGPLTVEASPSHSVGLLWTSDQPDNTQHSIEPSMPPSRFEPITPASEQPQTNALDCAVTETGHFVLIKKVKCSRYRPGVTQRVGRGIALLFHDRGTRRG